MLLFEYVQKVAAIKNIDKAKRAYQLLIIQL